MESVDDSPIMEESSMGTIIDLDYLCEYSSLENLQKRLRHVNLKKMMYFPHLRATIRKR